MKTILVVEDDAMQRHMLRDMLDASGYKVLEAGSGVEALKLLEATPVQLIISDRSMPQMDGLEFLKQVKARRIDVPFLIISAYGEERLWGDAIALGAQDYILKPVDATQLANVVNKCLKKGKGS